jgi:hypothetical protein
MEFCERWHETSDQELPYGAKGGNQSETRGAMLLGEESKRIGAEAIKTELQAISRLTDYPQKCWQLSRQSSTYSMLQGGAL